jgi:IS605 OrfB family transposase
VRFGFSSFERFCPEHATEFDVLNRSRCRRNGKWCRTCSKSLTVLAMFSICSRPLDDLRNCRKTGRGPRQERKWRSAIALHHSGANHLFSPRVRHGAICLQLFHGARWFIAIQVEIGEPKYAAPAGTVAGVDLGAVISSGGAIRKVPGPKPRRKLSGRIRRQQRRIRLQKRRAKKAGQKASRQQFIRQPRFVRLHARLANMRKDALHKLTTDLTRRFETIVIEDLNVSGMSKNHAIAGVVPDCGFYECRRQLQYKAAMRGGRIVVADRFFPSSKTCSSCGCVNPDVVLGVDEWTCSECGTVHNRDANAAINLEKIGLADAESTRGDTVPLSTSSEARKALWKSREPEALTIEH